MFKFTAWMFAVGAAAFFSMAVPAMADKAPDTTVEDAKDDTVVTAWKAYETAKADYDTKYKAVLKDYNDKKTTVEEARAAIAKLAEELAPTKKTFIDELAGAEWKKYAGDEHKVMLEEGLFMLAQTREEAGEHAKAAETYQALLEYVPAAKSGGIIRSHYLPGALIEAGELEKAIKAVKGFADSAAETEKPGLLVKHGDLLAASGETDSALKSYQAALDAIGDAELGKSDPRVRAKADAETRKQFIGQPAPNIDSKTWIDGEAKSLEALKGNVVILDFWATWCPPCRAAMPGLDKIYKDRKDKGVIALGVTHYYKNGFLPTDASDLQKGESFKDIKEEDYVAHVTKFKEITGLSYPFVIGVDADFKNYGIRGIPQMVIVDKQGKVALLVVGSGNDKLIETCVDALLKKGSKNTR
jgi:thiol-disulfide isomerase/thioredoxin